MAVSARLRTRLHRMARFWPADRAEPGSLPALQVAGVLVFAYVDSDGRTLRVSVDLDTTHPALVRNGKIPMHVTVQGTTVYQA
ncbi:hypothetical protein ACFV3E_40850 [Streptomyces sp. NPDC059718]